MPLHKENIELMRDNLAWLKDQIDLDTNMMQDAIDKGDEEYIEKNGERYKNLMEKTKLEFKIMYKIFQKEAPNHDITRTLASYILMEEIESDD